MRIRTLPAILLLGLIALAGCGGGVSPFGVPEIARYHASAGRLPPASGQTPGLTGPIPGSLLSVLRTGMATYAFNGQPPVTYRVGHQDFLGLQDALAAVDFQEAEQSLGGATRKGVSRISVSHDGTQVHLGSRFFVAGQGRGPVIADEMDNLLLVLDRIAATAPGAREAREAWARSIRGE